MAAVSLLPFGISACGPRGGGFHVYGGSTCFSTVELAVAYRVELDRERVFWGRPQ